MALVYDREFIARIVKDGESALQYVHGRKIAPDMLGPPYNKALELIERAYKQHHVVPSKQDIEHLIEERLPDLPSDEIPLLSDRIVSRAQTKRFRKVMAAASEHTREDGDIAEAFKLIKEGIAEIEDDFIPVQDETVDFASEADERWATYERIRDGAYVPGVKTPWRSLNDITDGFPRGQVSVILGGTSVGKTMVAVVLLKHFLETGTRSLLVSMEASKRQICNRLDGMLAQLPSREIATGRLGMWQEPRYYKHLQEMEKYQDLLYISAGSRVQSVDDLDDEIRKTQPSVMVIDAMYFLKGAVKKNKGRTKDWEEKGDVVQSLKLLARRHNDMAIVVTSQFSKEGMKRKDGGRLTEAGFAFRIVQDSPVVIAVKEEPTPEEGVALRRIEVQKNSEGPLGEFLIYWDCELSMNFDEVIEEEPDEWIPNTVSEGFE